MQESYIVENLSVFRCQTFEDGSIAKGQIDKFIYLYINVPESPVAGETYNVEAGLKDWQGNDLAEQTGDITVIIEGETIKTLTLTPVNGAALFDFEPLTAGEYVFAVSSGIKSKPVRDTVVVVDA